jgi:hypothetical protein
MWQWREDCTCVHTQLVQPSGLEWERWQSDVPDGDLKQRLGAFVGLHAPRSHVRRINLYCQATLAVLLPDESGEMLWDVPIYRESSVRKVCWEGRSVRRHTSPSIVTRNLLANIDPRDLEVLQEEVHIAYLPRVLKSPWDDGELVVWANGRFAVFE